MHSIKLLKSAEEDLKNISNYISEDNSYQAKLVLNSIKNSINYLLLFPFLWKERKDWLREIIDKNYKYRIFYKVSNTTVYIISIFKFKNNF